MERVIGKYFGVVVMYVIGKWLKKCYNIVDECVFFYDVVDEWVKVLDGW